MRCQFCGWDNPLEKNICEKCGKPLIEDSTSSVKEDYCQGRPTARQQSSEMSGLKATVREKVTNNKPKDNICPICGYTLNKGVCPSCGYDEKENNKKLTDARNANVGVEGKKTIRPIRKEKEGAFLLIPISEENGEPEGSEIRYDGNNVILNRDNTDPKNSTITSQNQAIICLEDEKWTIQDCSEYKTTFVQASQRIELQDGMLILLGNQLFRFDIISE